MFGFPSVFQASFLQTLFLLEYPQN